MLVKEGDVLRLTCGFQDSLAYLLESSRYLFQSEKHAFKGVYKFGQRVKLEKPTSQSFKEHPCFFTGHSASNSSKVPSLSLAFYYSA